MKQPQNPLQVWFCAASLLVAAASGPAAAQDASGSVLENAILCADVDDDELRLECYDESLAPLLGDDSDATLTFSGEGNWESDPLHMTMPWRLVWKSNALILSVDMRSVAGGAPSILVSQVGDGDGQTDLMDPGEFVLTVSATGSWRLMLFENDQSGDGGS